MDSFWSFKCIRTLTYVVHSIDGCEMVVAFIWSGVRIISSLLFSHVVNYTVCNGVFGCNQANNSLVYLYFTIYILRVHFVFNKFFSFQWSPTLPSNFVVVDSILNMVSEHGLIHHKLQCHFRCWIRKVWECVCLLVLLKKLCFCSLYFVLLHLLSCARILSGFCV